MEEIFCWFDRPSVWESALGRDEDADALYEAGLKQFLDMHLLTPVENFIRLSETEFVDKRSGTIDFGSDPNGYTNRSE